MQKINLSQDVQKLLRCPVCRAKIRMREQQLECTNSTCAICFPILAGIPVLLNEKQSVFSFDDFISRRKTFFGNQSKKRLKKIIRRLIPAMSVNITGQANYSRFRDYLFKLTQSPRVLVLGGSTRGQGMTPLVNNISVDLVETDVALGPHTMIICDAHDIPFENESFDGVVVQAVLEHVVDPYRCAGEIHRVLKNQGIVYAETAFMQQVHGGRYDFTRFTPLGHRRLFRKFDEIDSGISCGPGMALAWTYEYFLTSFTTSEKLRALMRVIARMTAFYLKYFDYHLISKPGALDAASGIYFMGKKMDQAVSDRALLSCYRGAG